MALREVDVAQVLVERFAIDGLAGDAAGLAQARGGGMRIGGGERFVGKPGVGDEAAGAGGAHDVAAPEGVDAEHGVCDVVAGLVFLEDGALL